MTNTVKVILLLSSSSFGHIEKRNYAGVIQNNYCCDKFTLKTGRSDRSSTKLLCCQGNLHVAIDFSNNAPISCTAMTQLALTQASSDSGSIHPTSAILRGAAGNDTAGISTGRSRESIDNDSHSGLTLSNAAPTAIVGILPWMGPAVVGGFLLLPVE
ncbi:hypothetical protein K431DRAFT_347667 [Polychaeton citri CBS 116435]|uniref:Uncharacterized protein n=1 Tax=Polychaeton citri CBS 116435 TaxID=1314669 RepID=A0A9P4UL42_9PEZI|nr:hypothetical protein K431DRAFT_347667 [Polychaeton citri CBS 116435]